MAYIMAYVENKTAKKFGHRYPWTEWFATGEMTLVNGVHYEGRIDSMIQMARNAAHRLKYELHVSVINGDSFVLRAYPND